MPQLRDSDGHRDPVEAGPRSGPVLLGQEEAGHLVYSQNRRSATNDPADLLGRSLGARTPLSTSTWVTLRAGRRRGLRTSALAGAGAGASVLARGAFSLLEDSVVFFLLFLMIC